MVAFSEPIKHQSTCAVNDGHICTCTPYGTQAQTPGDNIWVKVPSSLESIIANSEERVLQRLYDILIESLMVNHGDLQGITSAIERFNAARQRFDWAKKLVLDNEQR